jgi:hypothetical protein
MRNRLCTTIATAALVAAAATPALAQPGNGALSGTHYNLNIIGVENPKTSSMTSSQRHVIFVALGKDGTVRTNIYLEPSAEFQVCDGNGFDAAHSCSGAPLTSKMGAVFALPCNENLSSTWDDDNNPLTPEVPLDSVLACQMEDFPASYTVWARALGKVGGSAKMTTCATETTFDAGGNGTIGDEVCSLENVVLTRMKGKATFRDVTDELTSLVACYDVNADPTIEDIDCFRYALFRDEFTDWLWAYENTGLRLAQLRFYRED